MDRRLSMCCLLPADLQECSASRLDVVGQKGFTHVTSGSPSAAHARHSWKAKAASGYS